MMSLISKFTRKEPGKDIQMFVLLDQVHAAVAYLIQHAVLFIVCAYHFENDLCQKRECHVQRVITSPVMSHQVTEFVGSVADRKVH